jgi:hypothetical protein
MIERTVKSPSASTPVAVLLVLVEQEVRKLDDHGQAVYGSLLAEARAELAYTDLMDDAEEAAAIRAWLTGRYVALASGCRGPLRQIAAAAAADRGWFEAATVGEGCMTAAQSSALDDWWRGAGIGAGTPADGRQRENGANPLSESVGVVDRDPRAVSGASLFGDG